MGREGRAFLAWFREGLRQAPAIKALVPRPADGGGGRERGAGQRAVTEREKESTGAFSQERLYSRRRSSAPGRRSSKRKEKVPPAPMADESAENDESSRRKRVGSARTTDHSKPVVGLPGSSTTRRWPASRTTVWPFCAGPTERGESESPPQPAERARERSRRGRIHRCMAKVPFWFSCGRFYASGAGTRQKKRDRKKIAGMESGQPEAVGVEPGLPGNGAGRGGGIKTFRGERIC